MVAKFVIRKRMKISNSELLTLTRLRQENAQLKAENEDLRKNLREAALTWQAEHRHSLDE